MVWRWCFKSRENGKYGIIDLSGKELLSCEYDQISALSGIKNALKILKDGKYGIVDDEGKVILKTEYADITNLGKDNKSGLYCKKHRRKIWNSWFLRKYYFRYEIWRNC